MTRCSAILRASMLVAVAGCGLGGATTSIGINGADGPVAPGEKCDIRVTVGFADDGGPWDGRKVRLTAQPSTDDLVVDPGEVEATLDARGKAVFAVSITPRQDAVAGPRQVLLTAAPEGNERFQATYMLNLVVK